MNTPAFTNLEEFRLNYEQLYQAYLSSKKHRDQLIKIPSQFASFSSTLEKLEKHTQSTLHACQTTEMLSPQQAGDETQDKAKFESSIATLAQMHSHVSEEANKQLVSLRNDSEGKELAADIESFINETNTLVNEATTAGRDLSATRHSFYQQGQKLIREERQLKEQRDLKLLLDEQEAIKQLSIKKAKRKSLAKKLIFTSSFIILLIGFFATTGV